jgi:hypothetical protein
MRCPVVPMLLWKIPFAFLSFLSAEAEIYIFNPSGFPFRGDDKNLDGDNFYPPLSLVKG